MGRTKNVLIIAGSDSSSGAGLQADLKTAAKHGCYGLSVVTAVTAQNPNSVFKIAPMTAELVDSQIEALRYTAIDAVKIGMLATSEVVDAVSSFLAAADLKNVVLDPVMYATSGGQLLSDGAVATLIKKLLPLADVITPNMSEAETLLNCKIANTEQMEKAAKQLVGVGAKNVLLKGGHLPGPIKSDCFVTTTDGKMPKVSWFTNDTVPTNNTHGTGCTLASAIASNLALGLNLYESVQRAHSYVSACLRASINFEVGPGVGPLNHFATS